MRDFGDEYLFFRIGNLDMDALGRGVFAQDYERTINCNDQVKESCAMPVSNPKG